MKTRIGALLVVILFLHSLTVCGQWSCGFDEMHANRMKWDTSYRNQVNILNENIYNYSLKYYGQKSKSRAVVNYVIPVVVHLVVPPGTPIGQGNNLTDLQVEQGLEYLNEAFANQGPYNSTIGVDVGIQFCLARKDPSGQATNGITRDESPYVNDTMCKPGTNAFNDIEIKKISNWDCRDYINFWLVTDLFNSNFGCGLVGYAYFPGAPCALDGVVQESRYWNSIAGTAITAHEMGHYFSLEHTFNGGCANNDCLMDGDHICDTPPDNSKSFAPCNTNSCNTDVPDLEDDNSNYMDYSSCSPVHFTDGQRVRMIAALEMRRGSLIQSKGCYQTGDYDAAILDLNLSDFCKDTICPQLTLRNEGLKSFSSIFIDYSIDGIPQIGFMWNGNLNPKQTAKISIPCFNNPVGKHKLQVILGNPDNNTDIFPGNNSLIFNFDSYSALKVAIDKVTPSHCASDGTILLNTQGGKDPYTYKINNHSYSQSDPFFQLLLSGSYAITITDANLCEKIIKVNVPDSCSVFKNNSFTVNKDALSLGNDCYILTRAIANQVGSVWYQQKVNLNESFEIYFDLNLGCLDADGADGIGFVFQPISTSIGIIGGGLGFEGIAPSLDVEFDTFQNGDLFDPSYDHLSIMRDGNVNHFSTDNLRGPVGILPNAKNVEDCNFHHVIINWDAYNKTIEIKVDCQSRLKYTGDIVNAIFNGDPNVYFGFTGATGGSVNVQQVCFNYISTLNKLTDKTICKGESIQVSASPKFDFYQWSPSYGVSDIKINNPIFNPDITTTYYLEQHDICGDIYFDSFTIQVKELKLKYELQYKDSCGSFVGVAVHILNNNADTNILYSFDGRNFIKDTVLNIVNSGNYTLYAKSGNCLISDIFQIVGYEHNFRDSLLWIQAANCKDSGRIVLSAMDGIPPYQFRINSGVWQMDGIFDHLVPGSYTIEIKDQTSCSLFRTVKINSFINTIKLQLDSSKLNLDCCSPDPFVSVDALGSVTYYHYSMDNLPWTSSGLFDKLAPGKHMVVARDEFGCVSDTLDFEVTNQINTSIDTQRFKLCKGDFVKVGSNKYSSTGIYSDLFKNRYCCDSIIITDLVVDSKFTVDNIQSICQGEEILVGNKKYNTGGIYRDSFKTLRGCDSIILTDLRVHPVYLNNQNLSICEGEVVRIANKTYSAAGDYIDSLQTINSCDSIVNTHLVVRPVFLEKQNHNICQGQFVIVDNKRYDRSGIYKDTLSNIYGCDSIITTQLFIDTILADLTVDSILCFHDDNGRILLHPLRGIPQFKYALNDPLNYSGNNTFDQLKAGNYTLYLKDSLGCIATFTVTLLQALELQANMTSEIKINAGEKIIFNPILNFVPTGIQWIPSAGLSCSDCLHPELQPNQNARYEVIFRNEYDCEVKAWVSIIVEKQKDIYIPNAFSPNGDQINDRLTVLGEDSIREVLVFSIYDRWGELVFENHNFPINDLAAGWDGNLKGEKLNSGVFVYYAKAKKLDGTEVIKVGDVTLIR